MRTALRWIGVTATSLAALLVVIYAATALIAALQLGGDKDDARSTVSQLVRDTGDVDRRVEVNRETLGEPLRSWSQVVCDLEGRGGGWVIHSWYQRCSLQQVDIYPAAHLDRAEELADPHRRVRIEDSSDDHVDVDPVPTQAAEDYSDTAATPPKWSVRGELDGEDYTVVTVSSAEATTDLGCNPWVPLICERPVDRAVVPE